MQVLHTTCIKYHGHVIAIRPWRVEVSTRTIDAVSGLEQPNSLTELRTFLEMCNIFLRFVPKFACIAAPIIKKLCKFQLLTD